MSDTGTPQRPLVFRYAFKLSSGAPRQFVVALDPQTLELIQPARAAYPDWTRLSHHQCRNCPLVEAGTPRCPSATAFMDVLEAFGSATSTDEVEVEVDTAERRYVKRCPLQEGLASLIGLVMATSGCPVTAKLRAMARGHLPFSTLDETQYRVLSMYLLAQYFVARQGGSPDWDLKRLIEVYESVATVNGDFFKRVQPLVAEDASLNAIVRLDAFAGAIAFNIDQHMLDEVQQFFQAYLGPPPERGRVAG